MDDDHKKTDNSKDAPIPAVPEGYAIPKNIAPTKPVIGLALTVRADEAADELGGEDRAQAPDGGADFPADSQADSRADDSAAPASPAMSRFSGLRRRGRGVRTALFWGGGLVLSFLVLLQFAAIAGILWLQSEGGERFLGRYMRDFAAQNGYEVAYEGLNYGFPHSVDIEALRVRGADGMAVDGEALRLRVNVLPLMARTLSVSLRAQSLTVKTPPEPVAKEGVAPELSESFILPVMELPDFYVNKVRLDDLDIRALKINDLPVLAPQISASVQLANVTEISFKAKLYNDLEENSESFLKYFPQYIDSESTLALESGVLTVAQAQVSAPAYRADIAGRVGLGTGGLGAGGLGGEDGAQNALDLQVTAKDLDVAALSGDGALAGRAEAEIVISGALDAPLLKGRLGVDMDMLKARGLAPLGVVFSAHQEGDMIAARVDADTQYQDVPASLGADIRYADDMLTVRGLAATLAQARVEGDLDVKLPSEDGAVSADALPASAPAPIFVAGRLSVAVPNLADFAELTGIEGRGSLSGDIKMSFDNSVQSVSVDLVSKDFGLTAQDMSASSVSVTTAIQNVYASYWPQALTVKAEGMRIGQDVNLTTLDAQMSEQGKDEYAMRLSAAGSAGVTGAGAAGNVPMRLSGTANLSGLRAAVPAARDIALTFDVQNLVGAATGAAQAKAITLRVEGDANQTAFNLRLRANDVSMRAMSATFGAGLPTAIQELNADLDVNASGALDEPVIIVDAAVRPVIAMPARQSAKGNATDKDKATGNAADNTVVTKALRLALNGRYEGGMARVTVKGDGDGVQNLAATASVPMRLSLSPFVFDVATDAALTGDLRADMDGAVLAHTVLPPDMRFEGLVKASADVAGTLGAPRIQGHATIKDGIFDYLPYEIVLSGLDLDADFDQSGLRLKTLTAQDTDNGRLSASGSVGWSDGLEPDLALQIKDFMLFRGDEMNGGIDEADLTLKSASGGDGYRLAGAVTLGAFNIQIPERFRSTIPELNIVEADQDKNQAPDFAKLLGLDISVNAPDRIFVRGWGLDAEFGGAIKVTGTAADPLIEGDFKAVRGRYEELGKRFNLERAQLRFLGPTPPSPFLDIEASTAIDGGSASITIGGELAKPQVSLSSVPAMPQDEVMARILFGTSMGQITPFQAIQLKNTFDRFTGKGGGGFDPLGKIRSATGLDDVRVGMDSEGQSTVGVGKYLTDKVYLEFEQGQAAGSGNAKIEVELTPSISAESKIGQNSEAGGSLKWQWDY